MQSRISLQNAQNRCDFLTNFDFVVERQVSEIDAADSMSFRCQTYRKWSLCFAEGRSEEFGKNCLASGESSGPHGDREIARCGWC